MVLVCNDRAGAIEVLDTLPQTQWQHSSHRLSRLKHQTHLTDAMLAQSPRHKAAVELAARLRAVEVIGGSSVAGIVERS
jgi:beta-N-acetylhexosaminidase